MTMTTNAMHSAIQRSQAALDAQNAINVLWDGSPHTKHLFVQMSDLIDRLYELGKVVPKEDDFEIEDSEPNYGPSYADCFPDPWAEDYGAIVRGEL